MISRISLRRLAAGTALVAALAPAAAWSNGFYIAEQSARGTGRAYSGEVADTGTDSLWWNPAAIAGTTGVTADLNASVILAHSRVDNTSSFLIVPGGAHVPVGGDQSNANPIRNGVVPASAVAYGINDKVAFGIAISAPYNFTTQYPTSSWARYSALRSSLRTIDVQPTLAFQPVPGLRVGVGWNIEHVSATLSNAMPNLIFAPGDANQTLHGTGWDLGVSAGVQFARGPVTLGATYKSSIHHRLNGTLAISGSALAPNGAFPASADFDTPWMAIFGARLAVSPMLTLDAQVSRVGWSKFNAIYVSSAITGPNAAVPQNYRDAWTFAGGVDVALSPATTLRAGLQREMSAVRNDFRDARVPDSNRWTFALGGSHVVSRHLTLDAGAQYITFASGPITRPTAFYQGTPAQTIVVTNGELAPAHVFILSLGGRVAF